MLLIVSKHSMGCGVIFFLNTRMVDEWRLGEESLTERQWPTGSSKLFDVPETERFMDRLHGLHTACDRKIEALDQKKKDHGACLFGHFRSFRS
jgi:hypothetical protein